MYWNSAIEPIVFTWENDPPLCKLGKVMGAVSVSESREEIVGLNFMSLSTRSMSNDRVPNTNLESELSVFVLNQQKNCEPSEKGWGVIIHECIVPWT